MYKFVENKRMFTVVNVALLVSMISLYHFGFLAEISIGIFLILCIGTFVFSFYQPYFAFALFVGVLPLEIITVAPKFVEMTVRPYHILGVMILCSVIIALMCRVRSSVSFFSWNVFDTLVILLMSTSFISVFFHEISGGVLYHTVIFFSFGVWYFLTRSFVRSTQTVIALLPIFISSGVVVSVYAIIQNILYRSGGLHMEIMPGRPNATFTEPDWLGIYLVFIIAMCLTYLYYGAHHKHLWKFFNSALYFSTFTVVIATIITVARSAWVGSVAVFLVYCFVVIVQKKYKIFVRHFLWFLSIVICGVIVIMVFHLTTFELNNRVESTRSGAQEITVSCITSASRELLYTKQKITDIAELAQYNCRHIDLEEISAEERAGHYVLKIDRDDPNISVRSVVYGKSIVAIQRHPFVGYGWGSSGVILGNDASGTPLNASNIFLETALSIGIIGMGFLSMIFLLLAIYGWNILYKVQNIHDKSFGIFVVLGISAIVVPNFFNAGLLLGFVWVFAGMSAVVPQIMRGMK